MKALKAKFAEAGNPKVEVLVTLGGHPPKARNVTSPLAPHGPPRPNSAGISPSLT